MAFDDSDLEGCAKLVMVKRPIGHLFHILCHPHENIVLKLFRHFPKPAEQLVNWLEWDGSCKIHL